MALSQETYVERVLIVLNPDGTLKGAHQESLEVIKNDGEAVSEKQLAAAPLDTETLASILPDQAALAAQVQVLTDDLAAMTAERDALSAQAGNPSGGGEAVTALQARIALKQAGLLPSVEAVIAALPEDDEARIYWEYAVTIHRHNPIIERIADVMELTDEQVDALFVAARLVN